MSRFLTKLWFSWYISSTPLQFSNMYLYLRYCYERYLFVTAPSHAMAATICSHINESNRIIPIFRIVYLQCALYQKCGTGIWQMACSVQGDVKPFLLLSTEPWTLCWKFMFINVYMRWNNLNTEWIVILQSFKMFYPFSSINPTFTVSCMLHIVN
jgi:hypothetical protein